MLKAESTGAESTPSSSSMRWAAQKPKQLALDLLEPGGTAVWLGLREDAINLNSYSLTLGQKCLSGSYSGSLQDLRLAAEILSEGNLDTSWVSRYPIEQGEAGFRELLRPDANKIKVVLQF